MPPGNLHADGRRRTPARGRGPNFPPPRPPTLTFHHLHPPHNLPAGAARYNPRSVAAPYSAALSSSCPAAACPVSLVPSRGLGPPCTTPCSLPALRPALRPVASPGQTHPGYDYYLKRGASCVVSPRTVYTVVTGVVRNMIPEGGWCVFFDATDLDFGRREISCSLAPGALQSLRFFDPTYGGRASTDADTVSN